MLSDKYGNPIFQDEDIIDLLYKGQINFLDKIVLDDSNDAKKLAEQTGAKLITDNEDSIEFVDEANQCDWFIPENYCPNLIEMLYDMCNTQEQKERVDEELKAFIEHGMFDLLFALKYLVDTLKENNVVWGVGRGSSVASYVLFLIGVHRIDSIKYNLDWREFLR